MNNKKETKITCSLTTGYPHGYKQGDVVKFKTLDNRQWKIFLHKLFRLDPPHITKKLVCTNATDTTMNCEPTINTDPDIDWLTAGVFATLAFINIVASVIFYVGTNPTKWAPVLFFVFIALVCVLIVINTIMCVDETDVDIA